MEPVSLQADLTGIWPGGGITLDGANKDSLAMAFDKLILGLLLKDVHLAAASESTGLGNAWNNMALMSLTDELARGQTLGFGRLLMAQQGSATYSGGNP